MENFNMEFLKRDDAINRIKAALADIARVDRFILLARMEIYKDHRFLNCTAESVLSSLIKAASLGLYIGTGDAYLVPYNKTCTLQIGYLGMIKLMYRGGLQNIKAGVVHENDKFEFEDGTEARVRHIRALKDRGEMICAYAIAKIHNDPVVEIMDKLEIDFIREKFSKNTHIWDNYYGEMAKKTVIRRLFKKLPQENFDLQTIEVIKGDDPTGVGEAIEWAGSNTGKTRSQLLAEML